MDPKVLLPMYRRRATSTSSVKERKSRSLRDTYYIHKCQEVPILTCQDGLLRHETRLSPSWGLRHEDCLRGVPSTSPSGAYPLFNLLRVVLK
jgi:hypothetical protein